MSRDILNIKHVHIAALLFMLILSYPIQVLSGTLVFTKIFYIWVAILAIYFTSKYISTKDICKASKDKVFFYSFAIYLGVVLLGAFQELLYTASFLDFIRLLLLYFFPLILIFHALRSEELDVLFIFKTLLLISIIVSLESIYEFLLWKGVTFYEVANYEYVKRLTGRELSQLLGPLRHTGLLDHLHITGMFIGFGVIVAVVFYYKTAKLIYLVALFIASTAFIANGTRLMILTVTLFLLFYMLKRKKIDYMMIFKIILTVIFSFLFLYTISSDNKYFWFSIYFQYLPDVINHYFFSETDIRYIKEVASTQDSIKAMGKAIERDLFSNAIFGTPFFENNSAVLKTGVIENIYLFLFGAGFGTYLSYLDLGTDDLFILQLSNHLGIVGMSALLILLFLSFKRGSYLIKKEDLKEKITIWISVAFIFMMCISFLHSGIFIRKSMYALFFLFILIINIKYSQSMKKI